MRKFLAAIDQGTTGTTCLVVKIDPAQGSVEVIGRGYAEFEQHFPKPGWVEHKLGQIWESCEKSLPKALAAAGIQGSDINAIGITNQRETTGIWSEAGEPLANAIVWQDRRTASVCTILRDGGHASEIAAKTGLIVDPYFSGTKAAWILASQ